MSKASGLRVIKSNVVELEPVVDPQEEQALRRLEEKTFKLRPLAEYPDMDRDTWNILRMVQVYPDIAILKSPDWFGLDIPWTLDEMTPEENADVLTKITHILLTLCVQSKKDLLHRIQYQDIPYFLSGPNVTGFSKEMVDQHGGQK